MRWLRKLNGEKYKDLRTKLAQAGTCKLEGTTCSTGLRLSKEKLESCNVEDIKYTDVIHVAGKFYQPASALLNRGYVSYSGQMHTGSYAQMGRGNLDTVAHNSREPHRVLHQTCLSQREGYENIRKGVNSHRERAVLNDHR